MKPTFALNITDEAIGLLHRTSKGWTPVGDVAFAEPDLAEALGYLRKTALGLSPRGVTTKLVIPNSQILYTQINAPGPDEPSRLAQIRDGLEGRTPYDVADLVFDWRGDGPLVQVAVVARETLTQAEAFATENRLNPMSFVAIPESGAFAGEPFFGPTAHSATQLAEGEVVERDRDAIVIRNRALPRTARPAEPELPAPAIAPEPEIAPETGIAPELPSETDQTVDVAPPDGKKPAAEDGATAVPGTGPEPVASAEPQMFPPAQTAFQDTRPAIDPKPAMSHRPSPMPDQSYPPLPDPVYAPQPDPVPEPGREPGREPAPDTAPDPVPVVAAPAVAAPDPLPAETDEAPFTHVIDAQPFPEVRAAAIAPRHAATPATSPEAEDIPPAPAAAIRMAFASRRPAGDTAGLPPVVARPVAPGPMAGAVSGFAKPSDAAALRAARGKPIEDLPPIPRPAQTGAKPSVGAMARTGVAKGLGAFVGAPGMAGTRKKKPNPAPAASEARHASQTLAPNKPLTKPGGTFGARPAQRGKPRHLGLILTAILLVCLALAAALSSFYISSAASSSATDLALSTAGDAAPSDTVADTVAATDAADASAIPGIDDEMLADAQDPALLEQAAAQDLPADMAAPLDQAAADPQLAAPSPAPAPTAANDAPTPAPLAEGQDEIFLAAMDSPPPALDALALPAPETKGDAAPGLQAPPPPFGTVYQFDANGLIKPMPGGILTPEGVMLFAGKPPVLPPQRSATVVAAALALAAPAAAAAPASTAFTPAATLPAAVATIATAPADAAVVLAPPAADPALQGFRPRSRPASLAPAATEDGAAAAAAPDTNVASLRPRARPPGVLAAGEQAKQETRPASLATQAEDLAKAQTAALAAASNDPGNSSLLAISRRPAARPSDMSRAVEAAVAAAVRAPDPVAEPEAELQLAAAEPAPRIRASEPAAPTSEADDEPELTVAPRSTPLTGTVAKKATFVNAINLSRINLIGVYGSDSRRYALLRQANGRYKKVRVGDSVDGGKVAAITATEVRYQKGGRIVALKLPKS